HQVGERTQWRALVFRYAAALQPTVGRDASPQLTHEARLPEPRLAPDEHDSRLSQPTLRPGREQLLQLLGSSDERRLARSRHRVQPRRRGETGNETKRGKAARELRQRQRARSLAGDLA